MNEIHLKRFEDEIYYYYWEKRENLSIMVDIPSNNAGVGGFTEQHDDHIYSRFDWFRTRKLQNLVKGRRRIKINPVSHTDPYQFVIPANPKRWTDMKTLTVGGKYRVWNATKDARPAATENFSVVNNLHHSMWASIGIRVNGDEFESSTTTTYPFQAYLPNLINVDNVYKETIMEPTLAWAYDAAYSTNESTELKPTTPAPDDPAGYETEDVELQKDTENVFKKFVLKKRKLIKNPKYNEGYVKRRKGISEGAWRDFQFTPQHDLLTSNEIFEPNTRYDVVMGRMKDAFCIIQPAANTDTYRIEIENLHLTVEQVEATKATNDYHNGKKKSGMKPTAEIRRNIIKYYPVAAGKQDIGQSNIFFTAPLPEQVYVFFVDQAAFHGSKTTNPFHFEFLEIEEASLVVNGHNEPPDCYSTTKEGGLLDLYFQFLYSTGCRPNESDSVPITFDMFKSNHFILGWDRTPNRDNGFFNNEPDVGYIDLNIRLKAPLTGNNRMVVVYASYKQDVEMNGDRLEMKKVCV